MSIDYTELRRKMVDNQVRTVDVTRLSVLAALMDVARENFIPENFKKFSYIDEDIEVKPSQDGALARYVMEAGPFAKLLQLADISKTDVVLDVGCTTGYSAGVLSKLAHSVVALESDQSLSEIAKANLSSHDYDNVVVMNGPLQEGYKKQTHFDVIFIEGSVDFVPEALFSQLREGGRLVAVVGHGNVGVASLFIKDGGAISMRRGFNIAVKPLMGFLKEQKFIF